MASAFTKTTWVDGTAPALMAAQLNRIETGIYLSSAPLVASLPPSPVDGQECTYVADATNGCLWHFVYRSVSSSAYKWEWVGGTELHNDDDSEDALGASMALLTRPTALTLPLAGDYSVQFGAQIRNDTASGHWAYVCAGVTTPSSTDSQSVSIYEGSTAGVYPSTARHRRITGVSAGATLSLYGQCDSGSAFARRKWLEARPVRVG